MPVRLFSWALRCLLHSYRAVDLTPERRPGQNQASPSSYIYAIWHQNLIATLATDWGRSYCVMNSHSRDGELMATVCQFLGHHSVRGSSHRGGASALKGMVRLVRSGIPACITVDGPRGPLHQVKKGVFELSLLTGAPVIPLLAVPEDYWSFPKSWDQFRIPRPFSRIRVWHGEALTITREDKDEGYASAKQNLRHQLTSAEEKMGPSPF